MVLSFLLGLVSSVLGLNVFLMLFVVICGLFFDEKSFSYHLSCPYCGKKGDIERITMSTDERTHLISQILSDEYDKNKFKGYSFVRMGKDKGGHLHFLCLNCKNDIRIAPLYFLSLFCKLFLLILLSFSVYLSFYVNPAFGFGFLLGVAITSWQMGIQIFGM